MCGRIAQSRAVADYLETITWNSYSLPDALGPRYNVPPGTKPLTFHCLTNAFPLRNLGRRSAH